MIYIDLHSLNVYHGDIKPENILISSELHAVLCDLGHSQHCVDSLHIKLASYGTFDLSAPERLPFILCKNQGIPLPHDLPISNPLQADVFALGMLLYVLLEGPGKLPLATSLYMNNLEQLSSNACPKDPRDLIYVLTGTERRPDWSFPFFHGDFQSGAASLAPEAVNVCFSDLLFFLTPPFFLSNIYFKKQLVMGMLCIDPEKRMTMEDVIKHPWVGALLCIK